MADVRLVDLEVIKKYSLAVRHDTVPAEDVLAALEASLDVVRAALARGPGPATSSRAKSSQAKTSPAKTRQAKAGQTTAAPATPRRRSGRAGSE